MAIQINPSVSPRIITIPEADGDSITIQSLVNQIRAWEDNQANLSYIKLLSATGKDDLGGGALVGITAKLENAKVKFAQRASLVTCSIYGGNLVAIDANGYSMFPIEASTNVTVQLAQSSSPTLLQSDVIDNIQVMVGETQSLIANVQETVDNIDPALSGIHGAGSWEKSIVFEEG